MGETVLLATCKIALNCCQQTEVFETLHLRNRFVAPSRHRGVQYGRRLANTTYFPITRNFIAASFAIGHPETGKTYRDLVQFHGAQIGESSRNMAITSNNITTMYEFHTARTKVANNYVIAIAHVLYVHTNIQILFTEILL